MLLLWFSICACLKPEERPCCLIANCRIAFASPPKPNQTLSCMYCWHRTTVKSQYARCLAGGVYIPRAKVFKADSPLLVWSGPRTPFSVISLVTTPYAKTFSTILPSTTNLSKVAMQGLPFWFFPTRRYLEHKESSEVTIWRRKERRPEPGEIEHLRIVYLNLAFHLRNGVDSWLEQPYVMATLRVSRRSGHSELKRCVHLTDRIADFATWMVAKCWINWHLTVAKCAVPSGLPLVSVATTELSES